MVHPRSPLAPPLKNLDSGDPTAAKKDRFLSPKNNGLFLKALFAPA
jgi:hypothetical protein